MPKNKHGLLDKVDRVLNNGESNYSKLRTLARARKTLTIWYNHIKPQLDEFTIEESEWDFKQLEKDLRSGSKRYMHAQAPICGLYQMMLVSEEKSEKEKSVQSS